MKRSVWISAMVLFGACGGGRPSVDVNANNLCSEAAKVVCYDLYTCCTEGEIESVLNVNDPRSQDQCRADLENACVRGTADVRWSMDNGRVTLDTHVLDACLEALLAPDDTCSTVASVAPWAEACSQKAFVGTVAAGGDCFYDYECAGDGSYCAGDRTCKALPVDGEPCGTSGCAPAFYCAFPDCAPRLGSGDACTSTSECGDGLFCDVNATSPTCKAQHTAGQACANYDQCLAGSSCLAGQCDNGSSCFSDNDCNGSCEDDGSFCNTDSNCASGQCSTAGTFCTSDFNCTTPETCVFPVACLPGMCNGSPTCAENFVVYDYCRDVRSSVPL